MAAWANKQKDGERCLAIQCVMALNAMAVSEKIKAARETIDALTEGMRFIRGEFREVWTEMGLGSEEGETFQEMTRCLTRVNPLLKRINAPKQKQ